MLQKFKAQPAFRDSLSAFGRTPDGEDLAKAQVTEACGIIVMRARGAGNSFAFVVFTHMGKHPRDERRGFEPGELGAAKKGFDATIKQGGCRLESRLL